MEGNSRLRVPLWKLKGPCVSFSATGHVTQATPSAFYWLRCYVKYEGQGGFNFFSGMLARVWSQRTRPRRCPNRRPQFRRPLWCPAGHSRCPVAVSGWEAAGPESQAPIIKDAPRGARLASPAGHVDCSCGERRGGKRGVSGSAATPPSPCARCRRPRRASPRPSPAPRPGPVPERDWARRLTGVTACPRGHDPNPREVAGSCAWAREPPSAAEQHPTPRLRVLPVWTVGGLLGPCRQSVPACGQRRGGCRDPQGLPRCVLEQLGRSAVPPAVRTGSNVLVHTSASFRLPTVASNRCAGASGPALWPIADLGRRVGPACEPRPPASPPLPRPLPRPT